MTDEHVSQFDYPVEIDDNHTAAESPGYDIDRFECDLTGAYTHTGGWPSFGYCPYCGLAFGEEEGDA